MLDKIFFEKGRRLEFPTNHRLTLHEQKKVWYIEKGSMILFAARKKEETEGRRILFSTIHSDHLLFDMEREESLSYEIFAFSEEPVVLWELSVDDLKAFLRTSVAMQKAFAFLLERWLSQFAPALASSLEMKPKHWIFQRGDIGLKEKETFTAKISKVPSEKERVFWLKPEQGEFKLLGPYELNISCFFPMLPHLYFLMLNSTKLNVKTTQETIEDETWSLGLDYFHKFLGRFLLKKQKCMDQNELQRFEEKEHLQKETLHETLSKMASVLSPEESEERVISTDPIVQASQLILKKLGLSLNDPSKKWEASEVKERIAELAKNAGACIRTVHLGSLWWKFDSGPLLAFHGKESRAVALIPNHLGDYEMLDPIHKVRKKVTQKVARELSHMAYSFYIAIPDDLHQGKGVLLYYLKQNKKVFGKLALYGLISALFALFPPIGIAVIFNNAIPNANVPLLMQVTLGLGASALSTSLFLYFRALIIGRADGLLSSQIQPALWDRLLKLPANFFRRFTAGDLLQRVMAMEQMRPLLSSNVAQTILTGVFSLFYIVIMAIYSFKLTLIGIGMMVFALGITYFCARSKIKIQQKVYEMQGKINGALVQILSGVAKLRVAGAENNAFSYWAKEFSKSKSLEMRFLNIQNIIAAIIAAFPLFAFIVIFATVMQMEEAGKLSTGDFLAFNTAFIILSTAIFSLSNLIMQAAPIASLWKRSYVIIEEPQEILMKKSSPGKLTGNIRIDNVSFGYEEKGPNVLTDISIRVQPRQMVGIVGPSGSGKSTLIRIILGFEIPQSGAVYFNDKDLSHLNIHEVRKQMGVVLQGGGIIAGTLYQNVVAGGRYSEEEIDRAITLAGFKRDLQNFPMGLHTVVPMNGETLSGGQKQRLLIARALVPNPKILLFDEATSALDNRSQDEITHNIDQLDITRIVIAHRLSTIKNADHIYVIEKGRVTQSGSFEELAGKEGLFREMLKRQKL
jgi:NHLM bacteriocin system ABC transporter ATP-binding protein